MFHSERWGRKPVCDLKFCSVLFCTSCNRLMAWYWFILFWWWLIQTRLRAQVSSRLVVDPPACSHPHTLGNINERSRPDSFQRATLLSLLFVWKCLSSDLLCDVIGRSHLWLQPLLWRSETGTTSAAVRSRRCSTAPSLWNVSATRKNTDCKTHCLSALVPRHRSETGHDSCFYTCAVVLCPVLQNFCSSAAMCKNF